MSQTSASTESKMTQTNTVKFLVMADTHDLTLTEDTTLPFRSPLPKVDVVLHCGDISTNGGIAEYKRAIEWLGSLPAELKLVIAGNHDISLDKDFYMEQGGEAKICDEAQELWKSAKDRGIIFLEEGTHQFHVENGSSFKVYASPFTPKFGSSAFQYPTNNDRFNPPEETPIWAINVSGKSSTIPNDVDIVMTHGPPKYILDQSEAGMNGGCEHLRGAICRARPRMHCFGHIHHSWGAQRAVWKQKPAKRESCARKRKYAELSEEEEGLELLPREFVGRNSCVKKGHAKLSPGSAESMAEGNQTLFINAAVVNDESAPANAAWLVDMEFPRFNRQA